MQLPKEVVKAVAEAKHLVVFTGAGVSAESGMPTFRDALTGLWSNFDPMRLATPEAFLQDPPLVWGWYEWRRQLLLAIEPNPAHLAIAELAKKVPKLTLITQNVDDLHERAGSQGALHLHGSIFEPRCFTCAKPYTFEGVPAMDEEQAIAPPPCKACGDPVRPGVVWFGEALPEAELEAAFAAAENCDCFLSIGTSGVVQPAAQLPVLAVEAGAWVAHINPEAIDVEGSKEFSLVGKAGSLLPQLLKQVEAWQAS